MCPTVHCAGEARTAFPRSMQAYVPHVVASVPTGWKEESTRVRGDPVAWSAPTPGVHQGGPERRRTPWEAGGAG